MDRPSRDGPRGVSWASRSPVFVAGAATAVVVVQMAVGCDTSEDYDDWDYPPVCGDSGCIPTYGGCSYPRGIDDLTVSGPACLTVDVSMCIDITLTVHNDCEEDAIIGDLEVAAGSSAGGQVRKVAAGEFQIRRIDELEGDEPDDEEVTIEGTVGTEDVTIGMYYSGDVC